MRLKPYDHGCLAAVSYPIADQATRPAVLVDAPCNIIPYRHAASAQNVYIRHVLPAHFHTDVLAGHLARPARIPSQAARGAAPR